MLSCYFKMTDLSIVCSIIVINWGPTALRWEASVPQLIAPTSELSLVCVKVRVVN